MSERRIDPEQLAALLDGRLDERQRAEVIARLAKSPESFEAYVDAVAIAGELESGEREPGSGDVIPLTKPHLQPKWPVTRWRWVAAAAVVAGVTAIPLAQMAVGGGNAMDPAALVEALANEDAGLPAGWNGRPWSTSRSAVADSVTAEARAVRVGARLADLELAVRVGDTVAAPIAREIATLIETIPGSGPAASLYRELSQRSGATPDQTIPLLTSARDAVTALLGRDLLGFGAWVETARLASARGDVDFFRSGTTDEALGRAREAFAADQAVLVTIDRVRSALASQTAPDWVALRRDLDELLRATAT